MDYKIINLFDNEGVFITNVQVPCSFNYEHISNVIKEVQQNVDCYELEDIVNRLGEEINLEEYTF